MYDPLRDPKRQQTHRDTFMDLDYVYDPFDDPEDDFNAWLDYLYPESIAMVDDTESKHPLTGETYED